MIRTSAFAIAPLVVLTAHTPAQPFPPGYVDPAALLAAASRAIGEADLKCITPVPAFPSEW